MEVAVAFDHRGVKLRERVLDELGALRHAVVDLGTETDAERVDYPDKARELGEAIQRGEAERGILVCGSGVGASIAACKLAGIRAAVCHDEETARLSRQHNDLNVLALAGRACSREQAIRIVAAWLGTAFEGGRHERRLAKVAELEVTGAAAR